jgi:hypothetical protein
MSRKLIALRVGNFKAFGDTQRIPLKPITLVFGPNSAGKSSFIHSLALAHESQFGREKRSLARLDVYHTDVGGSAIDLGGFRQYVHRGQLHKRVEWGAELKVSELTSDKDQRLAQLLAPLGTVCLNIAMGIELDDQDRPRPGAEPRVEAIEISGDGTELLRMSRRPTGGKVDGQFSTLRLDRLASDHPVFRQILKAIVESATTSVEMRAEDFDGANEAIDHLLPELLVRIERFLPTGVELPQDDGADIPPVNVLFPVSKGNRKDDIAQAVRFYLPRMLNDLVKGLAETLAIELKQLQYLGPLRSFPPRHLAFAEHEDANWYAGGGYAWDVVRRDDAVRDAVNGWLGSDKLKTQYRLEVRSLVDTHSLLEPIATWLEPEDGQPFDFRFVAELLATIGAARADALSRYTTSEVRQEQIGRILDKWQPLFNAAASAREQRELVGSALAEINDDAAIDDASDFAEARGDHTDQAQRIVEIIEGSDIAKVRELVLVDIRKETLVTHRDVGIGISQVLPVLVMAYGSQGKLLAMEQPEIHLHPALQAELGDVFIESALGERRNMFILETHSEHLILRLMRRMRETFQQKETTLPPVTPADVSVLYVEPDGTRSVVREMTLNELGELVKSWPGGFFEEGLREVF